VIADRLWPEKNTRPLLADCESKEKLIERLNLILAEREKSYAEADLVLETSYSSVDTLKIELSWLEQSLLSENDDDASTKAEQRAEPRLLVRSIPLADSSYRSPREQKGNREVNDRMERLLKAQRHKERSDRRERPDKKEKGKKPMPAGQTGPAAESAGPRPAAQKPVPRENSGPKPAEHGPVPRENSGPKPAEHGPVRRENSGPKPAEQKPVPRESSGSKPAAQGPVPREPSAPRPASDGPVPRSKDTPSAPLNTQTGSHDSSTKE
jgi:hypothetical protein